MGRVISDARGMLAQSFWRIAGIAVVLFAVPAFLTPFAKGVVDQLGSDAALSAQVVVLASLLVATGLRLFGMVAFAGLLDEAVGKEYLRGEPETISDVLRRLPWVRLVVADVILIGGTMIGLALFVLPGLVFLLAFVLIGPVIVQEGRGVVDGFRRTFRITMTAVGLTIVLVLIPLAFEHALHELVHEALHSAGLLAVVVAEWAVAVVVGATIGLLEVALAAELMARNPVTVESD